MLFVGIHTNDNHISFAQQEYVQTDKDQPYALPWWVALIVGALISTIIQNIFSGIVPSKTRNKLNYCKQRLRKLVKNTKIQVNLIAKTSDLSVKNNELKAVIDDLRIKFATYGVSVTLNSLIMKIPIGKNTLETKLTISTFNTGSNEIVDQIECTIERECGYRNFENKIYEMREVQKKIGSILRTNYDDFTESLNLSCELKSKCEFIDGLSELKIETFSSKLTNETIVNLHKNKLTITSKELNEQIMLFVRKIVTLYY